MLILCLTAKGDADYHTLLIYYHLLHFLTANVLTNSRLFAFLLHSRHLATSPDECQSNFSPFFRSCLETLINISIIFYQFSFISIHLHTH